MEGTETPRTTGRAGGDPAATRDRLAEPPTGRALWPTFMRRTLDEHIVAGAPSEGPSAP